MIVVDTNILVSFWLPTTESQNSEAVFQKDPDWAVPILWQSEFRNVLALYLRKEVLTPQEGIDIMENAESQMQYSTYTVYSSDVLRLTHESGCSAYDCEFVALARAERIPLITLDRQILTDFPETAISPATYLDKTD